MARLEKQLNELHVMAREDREWRLSFWSNGSNRPLGFFQHRIQHDNARYGKLAETMATVIEGQASNASHLKLLVDREMQAAGRRKGWLMWARYVILPIVLLVLSGIGWTIKEVAPVWMSVMEDYAHVHEFVHGGNLKQHPAAEPTPPVVDPPRPVAKKKGK